ncbi:hypothetical protein E2C01_048763 [Portunus trituberculatus]|uniref:Uncharacterized protein n=1 Tax=Portunus trituberculatus TaxID=210409 RepID=A0A5B7GE87_PORTR|nr:hypothetical protein [Portunus trituberculatus]
MVMRAYRDQGWLVVGFSDASKEEESNHKEIHDNLSCSHNVHQQAPSPISGSPSHTPLPPVTNHHILTDSKGHPAPHA